jgi:carbon storage regulator
MLYLSRKIGESIVVNNNVIITVTEVKGGAVKLGLTFPSDVSVLRKEVYDRISEENAAAISLDIDALEEGLFDA